MGLWSMSDERKESLHHETQKKPRPQGPTALPRATPLNRGGGGDQDPKPQLPWPRRAPGRAGSHPEPLLQLCTSAGLCGMRQSLRNLAKDANIQDRTTGGVSKGWGRRPSAKPGSPQGCLLPGSGGCIPKATPHPVTPTPPDGEARVLEYCFGQLLPGGNTLQAPAGLWVSAPLQGNLVPSGSAPSNCVALADRVFLEHHVLRQPCLQGP